MQAAITRTIDLKDQHSTLFWPTFINLCLKFRYKSLFLFNLYNYVRDEHKYLGTTLTNQNSIQEEIKSRLKSGNA
jgi:hypothetical protein